ncbi:hypothetical protein [Candidatus Thiodiazotropha sp. CDECU1]|uniref:hypothetical protein n=1 Tax=Candidatus Thiodiazotropha sp. CDECU1 TaxID=3065865 RepID=UPI0029305A73|nr:hypothetical protein [Candidatus Thiodiazotropha sp. CDECU1]
MANLTRYWFEFEKPDKDEVWRLAKAGVGRGCGVTAFTEDDALNILKSELFNEGDVPAVKKVTPDIDVNTLDKGHVIPNMGVVSMRGVWYPRMNI